MAVRRLILFVALAVCLAVAGPAWAGTLTFHGNSGGQGNLSFSPGVGDSLTIGGGGMGALISDFFSVPASVCGGACPIVGGYMTLTTGPQLACGVGGCTNGASFNYSFGSGGSIQIFGAVPMAGINSSTLLFSANFNGGSFGGSGTVGSIIASIDLGSIFLDSKLGTYHFSGANNNDIAFNISGSCLTGGKCTGEIIQSDTTLQTIPEPATLSVLGVGLFTFGAGLRRKMLAQKPA